MQWKKIKPLEYPDCIKIIIDGLDKDYFKACTYTVIDGETYYYCKTVVGVFMIHEDLDEVWKCHV